MTINSTNAHCNNLNNILYTTKEAAGIINISQSTLRKYEEKYNIYIQRNEKGHRRYSVENIKEFQEIFNSKSSRKKNNEILLDDTKQNNRYISLESQNDVRRNFEEYITNFTKELFKNNNDILLDRFNNCLNNTMDDQIEKLMKLIKIENNQLRSENKRLINMVYELNSKVDLLIRKEETKEKPMSFNKLFSKNK